MSRRRTPPGGAHRPLAHRSLHASTAPIHRPSRRHARLRAARLRRHPVRRAPSSTTGRAASFRRRRGAERAGHARRRACASRTSRRRCSRSTTACGRQPEPLAVARLRLRRARPARRRFWLPASTTRPSWARLRAAEGPRFWMLYEPFIRRAAGLGRAGFGPDPARYERMHAFCDVLVVGGGPAGLSAALAAAEQRRAGRSSPSSSRSSAARRLVRARSIDGMPADDWARLPSSTSCAAWRMSACCRAPASTATTTTTCSPPWSSVADRRTEARKGEPRHRHWPSARRVVLATGAFERPLVFPGNDRPGVMLASAAERYAADTACSPASGSWSSPTTTAPIAPPPLCRGPAPRFAAIVDLRQEISAAARELAEPPERNCCRPTPSSRRKAEARSPASSCAASMLPRKRCPARRGRCRRIACWSPAAGRRPSISRARPAAGPSGTRRRRPSCRRPSAEGWIGAGAFTGRFGTDEALAGGFSAGSAAAGQVGGEPATPAVEAPMLDPRPAPILEIPATGKAFVDFQHDVTAEDVRLAHREGFVSVEHLKRYTTLGMAADQGKTSNLAGLAIMADLTRHADPRGRHDALPAALRAGAARRARRRALWRDQAGTPDADARLACRERRDDVCGGPLAAPADLRAAGRDPGAGLCPRGPRDAREGRHRRCLDARQDRRAGPGRGGFPRPRLHEPLFDAAGRQGALWADAARGRLRARRRHHLAACRRKTS